MHASCSSQRDNTTPGARQIENAKQRGGNAGRGRNMEHKHKADTQWRGDLTPEQYQVLREEGTERRVTSPLNAEDRNGVFVCAG